MRPLEFLSSVHTRILSLLLKNLLEMTPIQLRSIFYRLTNFEEKVGICCDAMSRSQAGLANNNGFGTLHRPITG
jgi:hypothetical protein